VATRLYAAIASSDVATVNELVHPAATLSVPGNNPVSGDYHGTAGLARFTTVTSTIAPGGAHTELVEVMGGDRLASVYGITRATRPGHPALLNPTIHLVTVEDGKVTAVAIYNRDQAAVDAFWS
jgi:hypothetical protein